MSVDLAQLSRLAGLVYIGDKVLLENNLKGEVRFIGEVIGKSGIFYGIHLSERSGKNNGCINKVRYFESSEDRGLFVVRERIKKSKIGNNEKYSKLPRVTVGDRVVVSSQDHQTGAVIKYVGVTEFSKHKQPLFGVELDKPWSSASAHDGMYENRRYFHCKTRCGAFITRDDIAPSLASLKLSMGTRSVPLTSSSTPRSRSGAKKNSGKKKTSQTPASSSQSNGIKKYPATTTTSATPPKRNGSPRKQLCPKMPNRYPSFHSHFQTNSNRKRSLLLVYGYCHRVEAHDMSRFFDTYYYIETERERYFDPSMQSRQKHYRVIPPLVIERVHAYLYHQISADDFEQISLIGKGGFAEVRLVSYKFDDAIKRDQHKQGKKRYFALKSLTKKFMLKKKQEDQIFIERDILIMLDHHLVTKLFWSFQDSKYLHLVLEFCEGGDLMRVLMQYEILSLDETQFYVAEIASVIHFIHEYGFIHRDIKPDNILLHRSGHIKLCDFGSAAEYAPQTAFAMDVVPAGGARKSRKNKKLLYRIVGTPDYVAPEVLSRKGYGPECDFWGLGVIMFECLCGYPPFYGSSPKATCRNILNYSKTFHIPADAEVNAAAQDCIVKLLCSWQSRLKYKQIQKHSFLKNIDWDNLSAMQPPHAMPPHQNDDDDDGKENAMDDAALGALYEIDEDGLNDAQLHYTMNTEMGMGMGALPNPSQMSRKRSLSKHTRNHFKGFTYEPDRDG